MRKACLIIIAYLLASFTASAAPNPETILVCYPGGAVNAKDANGAMSSMLRVVERVGHGRKTVSTASSPPNRGVAIFAIACFGRPSPTSGKNYATN